MRIRKNMKLSSMLLATAGYGGDKLETYVCPLNQSPWDVVPLTSSLDDDNDDGAAELTNLIDSSWFLPSPSPSSSSPSLTRQVIQFTPIRDLISISLPQMSSIFRVCFVLFGKLQRRLILDFENPGLLVCRLGLMGCYYFASSNYLSFSGSDYSFFFFFITMRFHFTQFAGEDNFNGNVSLGDSNGAAQR